MAWQATPRQGNSVASVSQWLQFRARGFLALPAGANACPASDVRASSCDRRSPLSGKAHILPSPAYRRVPSPTRKGPVRHPDPSSRPSRAGEGPHTPPFRQPGGHGDEIPAPGRKPRGALARDINYEPRAALDELGSRLLFAGQVRTFHLGGGGRAWGSFPGADAWGASVVLRSPPDACPGELGV